MSLQGGSRIALVVPCYNESQRFQAHAFLNAPKHINFCFVDDGSTDDTWACIEPMTKQGHAAIKLDRNQGKAGAVRAGIEHVIQNPLFSGFEWVGFWDADLAAPLSQVDYLLSYQSLSAQRFDAVVGSRVDRLGSQIVRSTKRHLLGRAFATVADLTFGIGAYDTQCGAKLFRRNVVSEVFLKPFYSRWIFDIEIFLRLRGYAVLECPLEEWRDVEGSKIKVLKVAFRVISDLIRIRFKYGATQNSLVGVADGSS